MPRDSISVRMLARLVVIASIGSALATPTAAAQVHIMTPALPELGPIGNAADELPQDESPTLVSPGLNLLTACKADVNQDGLLTHEDFDEFVGAFQTGETAGDFNGDGFLTFEDFDGFIRDFEAGCKPPYTGPLFPGQLPEQIFSTGNSPVWLAIGDLDGDGYDDFATANRDSGTVSILRSLGDGTFAAKVDVPIAPIPVSIVMRDFDSDGHLDLAVANNSGSYLLNNTVSVLRNLGDGTFAPRVDFVTGLGEPCVAADDLDGDGHVELVVTTGSNTVSVMRNTSSGHGDISFATKVDFSTAWSPRFIAIGDLDGDGRRDLAVACGNLSVSLLRNLGDITFDNRIDVVVSRLPGSIAIGDLDGDGRPDLAVAGRSYSNNVSVLRNVSSGRGDLAFGEKVDYFTDGDSTSVAIGDLNGDGRPDLAVANNGGNSVSVLRGRGNGSFDAPVSLPAWAPTFVAINDADRDGRPDLAVANGGENSVRVMRNISTPGGELFFAVRSDYLTGYPSCIAVGDLDGDDRPDLAVARSSGNSFSVLRNLGNGTFALGPSNPVDSLQRSVAIGDMDDDGHQDLVVANSGWESVSVLRNLGNGAFAEKISFATGALPQSVAIGDFDGDGRPDLAVANYGVYGRGRTVSILRNTSSGAGSISFADKVDYASGAGSIFVAIADLDSDGRPDLAVVNGIDGSVGVWRNISENQGTIALAPRIDYAAGAKPNCVAIGDLNGDGHPDLAVTNGPNVVSVLHNLGNGAFAPKVDLLSGAVPPSAVAIGDVDGDGRADVVTANYKSLSVSVLRNLGDGGFAERIEYAVRGRPVFVVISDLNGDDRPDLAVATTSGDVSILANLSDDMWP